MVDAAYCLEPKQVLPQTLNQFNQEPSLNLNASDSMKTSPIMKDALETTHEITKVIKYSPKRDAKLEQIRNSSEGQLRCGIRLLSPTRWTIRTDAMTSIISNYSVLHELWDWSLDTSTLIEMKARIRGVQVDMQQFEFFFGLVLGRNLLQHNDSVSVCLQRKSLSAAEGQAMAAI